MTFDKFGSKIVFVPAQEIHISLKETQMLFVKLYWICNKCCPLNLRTKSVTGSPWNLMEFQNRYLHQQGKYWIGSINTIFNFFYQYTFWYIRIYNYITCTSSALKQKFTNGLAVKLPYLLNCNAHLCETLGVIFQQITEKGHVLCLGVCK